MPSDENAEKRTNDVKSSDVRSSGNESKADDGRHKEFSIQSILNIQGNGRMSAGESRRGSNDNENKRKSSGNNTSGPSDDPVVRKDILRRPINSRNVGNGRQPSIESAPLGSSRDISTGRGIIPVSNPLNPNITNEQINYGQEQSLIEAVPGSSKIHEPGTQHVHQPGNTNWLENKKSRRFRRKYSQILRKYKCSFAGCTKSYGSLNHLNTHIVTKKHGQRKSKADFQFNDDDPNQNVYYQVSSQAPIDYGNRVWYGYSAPQGMNMGQLTGPSLAQHPYYASARLQAQHPGHPQHVPPPMHIYDTAQIAEQIPSWYPPQIAPISSHVNYDKHQMPQHIYPHPSYPITNSMGLMQPMVPRQSEPVMKSTPNSRTSSSSPKPDNP